MFSRICLLLLISSPVLASYEEAESIYGRGSISTSGYRRTINELVDGGFHFSAVPWMKDYLVKNKSLDADLEHTFDKIISVTGVKPFESLPEEILERSRSGNVRYILAKRLLKKKKYNDALRELNRVNVDHPAYPYVANMKGTILSILKRYPEAETHFKDCVRLSDKSAGKAPSQLEQAQLLTNRDFCTAGIARAHFANGDYKKAELNYLDIQKSSPVWPEILFEEAWTSYYLNNHNRTLGKLVSYKAPVFDFIFKPEVEVLKALSYMKMCLYNDAKNTADAFQNDYMEPAKDLRRFIVSRGKDYRYYYTLMADHESNRSAPLPVIDSVLRSISKDSAYREMKGALSSAIAELNQLRGKSKTPFRANLIANVKTALDEYRTLIGAYVRSGMVNKYAELYSAFEGMSYIKLEILAQRKERLYQSDTLNTNGKRGDVKYIERNDKQYFWTFNGEFWADELGDYVFALRSEC